MPQRSPRSLEPDAYWLGKWFTGARREGFLALLTPEAWHTLCAILSFTSRDGRRCFTLDQLAVALGQPREVAEQRLEQLATTQWRGQALLTVEFDRDGAVAGAVLANLEVFARVTTPELKPPRNEPDRVADAMADSALRSELARIGLEVVQIDHLLSKFPAERIQRQLAWLPERDARNPAALLLRAIEQDWDAPREGK